LREPAVTGDEPLQPRDLLRLLCQLRLQLRVLGFQPGVLRLQSRAGRLQRGNHIRRTRHTGATSEPVIRKQRDTPSPR
jgi:hypothetical protein